MKMLKFVINDKYSLTNVIYNPLTIWYWLIWLTNNNIIWLTTYCDIEKTMFKIL